MAYKLFCTANEAGNNFSFSRIVIKMRMMRYVDARMDVVRAKIAGRICIRAWENGAHGKPACLQGVRRVSRGKKLGVK